MLHKTLAILIISLSCSSLAFAQGNAATLTLNDKSVGLDLNYQVSKTAEVGLQYIYQEKNGSYADLKFNATHANGIHQIAIGGKGIAAFTKDRKEAQAIALGGSYRLVFSQQFAIHAQGYYAPSVLSFNSLEEFVELDGHVEFKLIPTLALLGGYRYIALDYNNENKLKFENGLYFGMKFTF